MLRIYDLAENDELNRTAMQAVKAGYSRKTRDSHKVRNDAIFRQDREDSIAAIGVFILIT